MQHTLFKLNKCSRHGISTLNRFTFHSVQEVKIMPVIGRTSPSRGEAIVCQAHYNWGAVYMWTYQHSTQCKCEQHLRFSNRIMKTHRLDTKCWRILAGQTASLENMDS